MRHLDCALIIGAAALCAPLRAEELAAMQPPVVGARTLAEILGELPGIINSAARDGEPRLSIRGLDSGRSSDIGLRIDSHLVDRTDDLFGMAVDLAAVRARIGPAGPSMNGGALAGVIELESNRPRLQQFATTGRVEFGSFGGRHAEGVVNVPIGSTQALRMAIAANARRSFVSSGSGSHDRRYLRLRYLWQPRDNLEVLVNGSLQREGGSAATANGLLYTGTFVPYSGDAATAAPLTGQVFAPGEILLQSPTSISFAPGSVLAPGAAALATLTTRSYRPTCNPVGLPAFQSPFTSGKAPSAPFVALRGCPVTAIAVRDNVNFFERANPWNDGADADEWGNKPDRRLTVSNLSGEVRLATRFGDLTLLPAVSRASDDSVTPGLPYETGSERWSAWQLEARLSAQPGSRLYWQTGARFGDSRNDASPRLMVSPPTAALPALAPGQTTTDGYNALTGVRTLLGNCYLFAAGNCQQMTSAGGSSRRRRAELYGDIGFAPLPELRLVAGIHHRREQLHLDDANASAAGNLVVSADPLQLGGYLFSSVAPGTNCATAVGAAACKVQFVATDLNSLQSSIFDQDWNGGITIRSAGTDRVVRARTRAGATHVRLGATYEAGPHTTLQFDLGHMDHPGSVGSAPSYDLGAPLQARTTSLGVHTHWAGGKLLMKLDFFETKVFNQAAAPLIDLHYSITPAGGTQFSCPTIPGVPATARLGPLRTNADTCFNMPVSASTTADSLARGIDLRLQAQLSPHDQLSIAAEWLPESELAAVRNLKYITASDVLAAAAANIANPSIGSARDLQVTAEAIAAGVNAQNDALQFHGHLPLSPRLSFSADYGHRFDLPGGGRLTPRLNLVYKSAYWITGGAPLGSAAAVINATQAVDSGAFWPNVQPSHRKWNFYADWRSADGRWGATAYVTNIGNVPTLLRSGAQTTTTSAIGSVIVTGGDVLLAAPRQFGIAVNCSI